MRVVLKWVLPVVAAALFLLPNAVYAQTGSIAGQAKDQQGGALPGVTVEVTSPALIEKVRTTVTDSDGRYQITALPVGTYEVTFKLESFATFKRANVVLTSDFTANVVADMKVGQVTDTVNVTASAPVVDVQNARVQQTFQGSDIAELPTQRDIPSLLLLVPALTSSSTRGSCNGGVGTFCNPTTPQFNSHTSGLDTDGQNQGRIMVDGIVINGPRPATGINENVGVANGMVIDTANAQEVSFTLSGSLGESETGGASINIVPRTGGNRFTGNYFTSYTGTRWFDRNRKTRLVNSPAAQTYNWDYDVNGAFGGPIKRDRFWFYAYARKRGSDNNPGGGAEPAFKNLNEGKFAANYLPDRDSGRYSYTNEYTNGNVRLTLQASQRNKFNIYWDEQDSCTNPCHGMISLINSPESYFTLQSRPNRLMQLSWTNPFTNRMLFDARISTQLTHQDQTKARDFTNPRSIPRVCEAGPTVGRDAVAILVNTQVSQTLGGAGSCGAFTTMNSGSINDAFPGIVPNTVIKDRTFQSQASVSYITGSHNAKLGYQGAYYGERIRNEVNDMRTNYHYQTPQTTGTWNATTRNGNCLVAPTDDVYACGNMSLYFPEDVDNKGYLRPRPVGFDINTGIAETDERAWFGALYVQDQWTLNRFTVNGALRYDHAESGYGQTCIGPDLFVPVQDNGQNFWCTTPAKGVRYNDITPRWGVAWDVFGNGKTSIKWNMGKYLSAASLDGLYVDNNDARRATQQLTRGWDDLNGDRLIECNLSDPNPHTLPGGDFCGTMLTAGTTTPTNTFLRFGRAPNASQLFNANSICGRTDNSSDLHKQYCAASGENLMSGWGTRRAEWQFGLGVQHELLPRLSVEVTYNRRIYGNLTSSDTVGLGCDYYLSSDPQQCFADMLNYVAPQYDFYSFQAPVDPRLPGGGGYTVLGNANQKLSGALPSSGNVTTIQKALNYSWNGVDTNFVLRARGGLRLSGGTSTGRSNRDSCFTEVNGPNVRGREGNDYAGGCRPYRPFQTNVRANASYTIPWADVLVGTVFQYRPGVERSANLVVANTDVLWAPLSQNRSGTQFNTGTGTTATQTINMLDSGDLYGEGFRQWDLNFSKNVRFARKRVNFGLNIYNLFNMDAATGYQSNYVATRLPDGTFVDDNPATPQVEVNNWGQVTGIAAPRFARFTVQFDF